MPGTKENDFFHNPAIHRIQCEWDDLPISLEEGYRKKAEAICVPGMLNRHHRLSCTGACERLCALRWFAHGCSNDRKTEWV